MKLLPSWCILRSNTPDNHAPCHVTSCKARYVGCVCASSTFYCTCYWGWNGYQDKSQHRKLTLEKKILQPLMPAPKMATFRSHASTLTTELSLLPNLTSPKHKRTEGTTGKKTPKLNALSYLTQLMPSQPGVSCQGETVHHGEGDEVTAGSGEREQKREERPRYPNNERGTRPSLHHSCSLLQDQRRIYDSKHHPCLQLHGTLSLP